MKNIKEKFLFIILAFSSTFLYAQEFEMKGKVLDAATQEPLMGVNIMIQNTDKGTITDFDGSYSLSVNNGNVIEFSYLGYEPSTVTASSNNSMVNVQLNPSEDALSEVVVIGYGTSTKKDLSGSVASIKPEGFVDRPITTLEDALQGNASGLLVQSSGGQPGAAANINIRGITSLTGSTQPLIVIDGFPLFELTTSGGGGLEAFSGQISSFAFINPNDIASVEVLKDASATAIYGNRGANGVIMITTKKGKYGKPKLSYNSYFGVREIQNELDMLSFADYARYQQDTNPQNLLYTNPQTGEPYQFDPRLNSINWQDRIYRTGFIQNHSLSLQGGNENTKYFLSGSFMDDRPIIDETNFKKYDIKLSLDQRLRKNIKVGASLSYNFIANTGVPTDGREGTAFGVVMGSLIGIPLRMDEDTQAYFRRAGVEQINISNFADNYLGDPENIARNTDLDKKLSRFIANSYFDWNITKKLNLRVSGGVDMFNGKDQQFYPTNTPWGFLTQGSAVVASFLNRSWLNENILTYNDSFGKNHKINIVGGATVQSSHFEFLRTENNSFENEILGYNQIGSAGTFRNISDVQDLKLLGFLLRANYTYKDKLIFTLSGRRDGTSVFKNNKWGNFYSGAIAYNLGEEDFMKDIENISLFKFRGSIGETGNANVSTLGAFSQLRTTNYNFDDGEVQGQSPANLANENLSWETTQQINFGIDLGLFDDKLSLTADYYIKNTKDLILQTPIPNVSGFDFAFQNIGEIQNSGVEFSLNTLNVKTTNFEWSTNFNFTYNTSEIKELGQGGQPIFVDVNFDNIIKDEVILEEGGEIGSIFGYQQDGIYLPEDFDADGNLLVPGRGVGEIAGDIKFRDINGDGVVNAEDRTVIGNTLPDFFGALNNTFKYKAFDLNILLQYSIGNDVFNATRTRTEAFVAGAENQSVKYLDRWSPENPTSTQYARFNSLVAASTFVEDASFVRIRNVRLGYNLPPALTQKAGMDNIRLYVSADNLAVFTNYSGYDPEISTNQADGARSSVLSSGFDYGGFPRARTITFGLNLDF